MGRQVFGRDKQGAGLMAKPNPLVRAWKYATAWFGAKVDEKADFETQDKQRAARKAAIEAAVGLGWGPLIKCTVSSQFDKGDAEKARRLYEELRGDNSAKVDLKEDIHPQTLFAQVRRAVEEGKRVPLETLGVNVISGVKLTKRPKEQI